MTVERDELWVDMAQFDTRIADGVWDGDAPDPDAPRWFADVRSLVHRARGPAEPAELVDEPLVVDTMRRATLGETLADLPRRRGVRAVGRLVAMKAAAATTASVMTMAAAAATTGIVATVAATVVVPVIQQRVMTIIDDEPNPPVETQESPDPGSVLSPTGHPCGLEGDACPADADDAEEGNDTTSTGATPAEPVPADSAVTDPDPVADTGAADAGATTPTTVPEVVAPLVEDGAETPVEAPAVPGSPVEPPETTEGPGPPGAAVPDRPDTPHGSGAGAGHGGRPAAGRPHDPADAL